MKNFVIAIIINVTVVNLLCAQGFQTEHLISYGSLNNPSALYSSDLDNDGDYDILTATYGPYGRITWVENLGGAKFGLQHDIHTDIKGATDVFSIDIDGDGDQDVLVASQMESAIYWYENSGDGNFSEANIISGSVNSAQSVFAIDLDNDGDNDVLSAGWTGNQIAWYKNLGNGDFGIQQAITTNAEHANSVFAIDLDNDGDNDVLSASSDDNKIAWYENLGDGVFGAQQVISTDLDYARSVYAADMDLDGDNDVLSASFWDGKIAWYENFGGGIFSEQKIIILGNGHAQKVFASDLDNDGDFDVLSASYYEQNVSWYENLGDGTFGEQNLISENGGIKTVYAVDLDNDGDNDIISNVFWYENMGEGEFSSDNNIITAPNYVENVVAVDVDNDLDMDVFYAALFFPKIGWLENDGILTFENHHLNTPDTLIRTSRVFPFDFDNDGLIDIFAGFKNVIVWYHNENNGTFTYQGIIDSIPNNIESLYLIDFDNDGDPDILASSSYLDVYGMNLGETQITWIENMDNGAEWISHVLYSNLSYQCTLQSIPTDLDKDGDIDILSRDCYGYNFYWFENAGNGNFLFTEFEMPDDWKMNDFDIADVDSDYDIDIIATALSSSKYSFSTIWLENDGTNNFDSFHYVDEDAYSYRLLVKDLDNDEDQDIVINTSDSTIGFYFNDGNGNFYLEEVFEAKDCDFWDISSADMDNDEDMDILYISDVNKIAWIENQYYTAINALSKNKLTIFPNPATNLIYVDYKEDFILEIYNYHGNIILSSQKTEIDIAAIAKGIYQVILKNTKGHIIHSEKIIKM